MDSYISHNATLIFLSTEKPSTFNSRPPSALREANVSSPPWALLKCSFLHLDLPSTSPVTPLTHSLTRSLRFPLPLPSFYHLRSPDELGCPLVTAG